MATSRTVASLPTQHPTKDKVCIIGSGNWGSAISILVGQNCRSNPQFFDETVSFWVFEEVVRVPGCDTPKNLSQVINERHENVKYLPGIALPTNVVAIPDLAEACRNATLLVFVLPHQFLPRLLPTIRQAIHPQCRGVSLIKGLGTLYLLWLQWLIVFSRVHNQLPLVTRKRFAVELMDAGAIRVYR